jgi:hypothetical protein
MFDLLRDFLHENHYLGGKNSARFFPQRGVAARRYVQLLEMHRPKIG